MKSQKLVIFSLLMLCASIIIQTVSSNSDASAMVDFDDDDDDDESSMFFENDHHHQDGHGGLTAPIGGTHSRFLADADDDGVVILANYTCDLYPTVCRYKKSDTKDCCGKKCVNVMTDRMNCFKCGHVCNQGELCCKGKCVNINSNRKHCGGCNIKCRKRVKCDYGICGYAG